MKILISGGGTAGHINPAIAVADYIKFKQPDAQILFVGCPESMEATLVPKAGYKIALMEVSGFQRKLALENIKRNAIAVRNLITSSKKAKRIIMEFNPDVAIGTGGYVCGPILRKSAKMGVPVLVHESNSFPGITTKMLANYASCIMVGNSDAANRLRADVKIEITGNPVRADVIYTKKKQAKLALGLDAKPLILSMGGSLGARRVNEACAELIAYSAKNKKYNHIHSYGRYGKWLPDLVQSKGVNLADCKNIDLREYIDNIPIVLAAADLVISRAGALSIAEIQAQGKASILIPSPNVAENHQYHNAMTLVKNGAAILIEEKYLTGERLINEVESIIQDPEKLKATGENAQKNAILDAVDRIYKTIVSYAGKNNSKL